MRTLPITGTPLTPSVLCLGTALFGSAIPREDAFALMDAFMEGGGNFLDTASIYANWLPGERSASEKTIGRWMQARGNRDRVIVATKGAHHDSATKTLRLARPDVEADLANSLTNLQTDVIDLYWLHRDDVSRPVEEIMQTLHAQVKAGKILCAGCSNWRVERIRAFQAAAQREGWQGFVGNQMMWSLGKQEQKDLGDPTMVVMDAALHAYHRETGLAAIPFSSQANGWFQKHGRTPDAGAPEPQNRYDTPVNEERLKRVLQLAAESGLSITQIVLGYLTSQPFATFPIIGSRSTAQLRDSLTAGDIRLSPVQLRFLTPDHRLTS